MACLLDEEEAAAAAVLPLLPAEGVGLELLQNTVKAQNDKRDAEAKRSQTDGTPENGKPIKHNRRKKGKICGAQAE